MKRVLSLVLTLLLCVSLCGCSQIEGFLEELGISDSLESLEIQNPLDQFLGGSDAGDQVVEDADTPPAGESTNEEITNNEAVEAEAMPKCTGESLLSVSQQLSALGVQMELSYEYDSQVEKDHIISQSIPSGAPVAAGTTVTLVVSKGSEESPYGYSQKLVVTAQKGSSAATATLYVWENGQWCESASYNAMVGKNGIGEGKEGSRRTPQGIHKLGVILSSGSIQTNFPVYRATSKTGVVNDTKSAYYNIIMEAGDAPEGASFDRIGKSLTNGSTYAMIYIEHNGSGLSAENVVAGKGSAIGVRGQYGKLSATYGDVDISYRDMVDLIARLDIHKNPVIEIKIS